MIGTVATLGITTVSAVAGAVHSVQVHEKGHSLEYDKEGITNSINYFRDDNGKFSIKKLFMPSCNARTNDVAQLTPEQCINNLSAGYRRNYRFMLGELAILGTAIAGTLVGVANGIINPAMATDMFTVSLATVGVASFMQGAFGLGNQIIPWQGVMDGTRVRNVKTAIKNYEKNPTLENDMKLQIAKILGIKDDDKKYDIEIKGNIAYIHSHEKDIKRFRVVGEADYYTYLKYNPETKHIDLINYNTKDNAEKSPEFLKAEKDFETFGKEVKPEKPVEIHKEPEFRFTPEKKPEVNISVDREPNKDKGMDI